MFKFLESLSMLNLILDFTACCRAAGLKVSTSEVLDVTNHMRLIDITDELQFKTTFRANFAKSRRDQRLFDDVYSLFFHQLDPERSNDDITTQSQAFFSDLSTEENPIFQAVSDFLQGNPTPYMEEIHRIQTFSNPGNQVLKSNMGPLSNRLAVMLQINRLRDKIAQFAGAHHGHIQSEQMKQFHMLMSRRLNTAFQMLTQDSLPHNDSLKRVNETMQHKKQLGDIPFSSLSPSEIEEMRQIVHKLVRKLKDIVKRRYAAHKRGQIDIKKTLRRSDRYQGVPLEIRFKKRNPRKGKIVTLCDISGSVWATARFMLNLLYSLQDCFSQVRSFVFVSGITEVTDLFDNKPINEAIQTVMNHPRIHYDELTNYGLTFSQFKDNYINVLTQKTTLIIVGDGRNNYFHPQENILEEMREKCRRIIWLNPEPYSFWNSGDSEMRIYSAFCHEVRVCQNLNQLIQFIEELVL